MKMRHLAYHLYAGIAMYCCGVSPAKAHHSFAMFDQQRIVAVDGVVTGFAWTNPHIFITMLVKEANGSMKTYRIEGGSPSIHMRAGWKANSIKVGDHIKLTMYPLRSGQPGGRVKEVTLPTGVVLRLTSGASPTS